MIEKEFAYLFRSPPIIFTLVMPVVILLVFGFSAGGFSAGSMRSQEHLLGKAPGMAFPVGAAYALLMLTNLVYNSLGADGAGVQFLLGAPVVFRDVMWAKNLTHATVLALETAIVWIGASLIFQPPSAEIAAATLAGLLFALPVNLAVGNWLSISSPKKINLSAFGKQRASGTTVVISLLVQMVVIATCGGTLFAAHYLAKTWTAVAFFLVLALVAETVYFRTLGRCTRLAQDKRETLLAELCKQ